MEAPSVQELANHPVVQEALEGAWKDSLVDDPERRHEEGGWIYCDATTMSISIQRAASGERALLNLNSPPIVAGSVVVGTFHTHPNPAADGWETGPSPGDEQSAWILGVPCIIRAEDGIHATGPDSRRGGLSGEPGYPK